jgi:hypothetical protein
MAQDLNKGFEQEKIDITPSSFEDGGLDLEKGEKTKESSFEREVVDIEKKPEKKDQEEKTEKIISSSVSPSPVIISSEEERRKQIDAILSDGLNDVFLSMTPKQQRKFQKEGVETVNKINRLLSQTRVKVRKIIELIRKWLKNIPKVNRYFLEQEAKIKTDKILKLKKDKDKK